jgi:PPOX class probable F420-dependent enzyme
MRETLYTSCNAKSIVAWLVCTFLLCCKSTGVILFVNITAPLDVQHEGMTMHNPHLPPFATQRYLNLESFKRDGTPVQTPAWFAEEQGVLYVYTLAKAGKVKRIRRHPRIRIAPCTVRGKVIGPWVEAEATIVDATTAAHGHALLRQKYGWMKRIGDLFSRMMHRERVVIAMRLLA